MDIWQVTQISLGVKHLYVSPLKAIEYQINGWTVCTDQWLLDNLHQQRRELLPNETGGVLIGSFDTQRRIVYVVDMLPSPPDSVEWPTVYIRGFQGLAQQVRGIEHTTAGMLGYVGEWHSHPDGASCTLSQDDSKAFAWLTETMSVEGTPGLMIIVGSLSEYACYIAEVFSA
jgi:integrative and conjugative element protein (TIGR02256 family)